MSTGIQGSRLRSAQARGRALLAGLRAVRTRRIDAAGAVVLAYHDVVERDAENYEVSARQLRRQLVRLRELGLRIVPIDALVERLEQRRSVDGLAVATFDDAYEGAATLGADVLEELEVPGCVFVPSDVLGTRPAWGSGKRIAEAATIRELAGRGFTIGSHSCSHVRLPQCPDDQLDAEIAGSRRALEDLTGRRVDVLAYPFGHLDERVVDRVQTAGYRSAFAFRNGRVTTDTPIFRVPRMVMGARVGRFRFLAQVARPAGSWPHGTGASDSSGSSTATVSDGPPTT